ncbi:MAG: hypothetical protein KJ069_09150 [Anaerolineae bacterium]|nr:hypothetical protein [Anaerolineae bacterium]
MSWKGTMRSLQAAQRRAERESRRKQRELENRQKLLEKMGELERSVYEVQVYENHIDLLLSVHKECGEPIDWETISKSSPPTKPDESKTYEESAQAKLDGYKPSIFDKVLKRTEIQREKLSKAVEEAREKDKQQYQKALQDYEKNYADWDASCELANKVLAGDLQSYLDAIQHFEPFSDIGQLGSAINFQVETGSLVLATVHVNDEQAIPSVVKSLLQSGKLSIKQMPKGKFYELYQDYICGCVLRVARELFSLLPIEMVIVTAMGKLLNPQTGHKEEQPILSIAIPRHTLANLNIEMIDPSDSMNNFIHRMSFKKTKGFEAVEALRSSELQLK